MPRHGLSVHDGSVMHGSPFRTLSPLLLAQRAPAGLKLSHTYHEVYLLMPSFDYRM
jgi:hypothetical protein